MDDILEANVKPRARPNDDDLRFAEKTRSGKEIVEGGEDNGDQRGADEEGTP